MATAETQQLDAIIAGRRRMLALGGTALAGIAFAGVNRAFAQSTVTDADILNFALNLEYLEAQYYTYATTGSSLSANGGSINGGGSGATGGTVTIKSNPKVPFADPTIASYAMETAGEERKHVAFLQNALGSSAVAMPNIDLLNSFNGLAIAADIGTSFDPFANDLSFLFGSFIFEDVGVTAYHGAAALLSSKTYLDAAAGIMAVEAYHAGLIRTVLYGMDAANPAAGINAIASKIAAARASLDGTGNDDIGLGTQSVSLNASSSTYPAATVVDADSNSLAFARTTTQVLSIVYAGGSGQGGFFPSGLNGNIK